MSNAIKSLYVIISLACYSLYKSCYQIYSLTQNKIASMGFASRGGFSTSSGDNVGVIILPQRINTQIATFMGPAWGLPGSSRPQMGPMLVPWTLLSGYPLADCTVSFGKYYLTDCIVWHTYTGTYYIWTSHHGILHFCDTLPLITRRMI